MQSLWGKTGLTGGIQDEFEMNMRLLGAKTIKDIVPEMVDAKSLSSHFVMTPQDNLFQNTCTYTPCLRSVRHIGCIADVSGLAMQTSLCSWRGSRNQNCNTKVAPACLHRRRLLRDDVLLAPECCMYIYVSSHPPSLSPLSCMLLLCKSRYCIARESPIQLVVLPRNDLVSLPPWSDP